MVIILVMICFVISSTSCRGHDVLLHNGSALVNKDDGKKTAEEEGFEQVKEIPSGMEEGELIEEDGVAILEGGDFSLVEGDTVKLEEPIRCLDEHLSCFGKCSSTRQYQNLSLTDEPLCFCDPECDTIFHDCCHDYQQVCHSTSMEVRNETNTNWQCFEFSIFLFKIWMIGDCAASWENQNIRELCLASSNSRGKTSMKVPVVDGNNTIYRNRYCAICNGQTDFESWNFEIACLVKLSSDYSEREHVAHLDYLCDASSLHFGLRERAVRFCPPIENECRYYRDKDAAKRCEEGHVGLVSEFKDRNYKNVDCFKCNTDSNSVNLLANVTCGPLYSPDDRQHHPISYSKIFIDAGYTMTKNNQQCPNGFKFDPVSDTCHFIKMKQQDTRNRVVKRYSVTLFYRRKHCSLPENAIEHNRLRFAFVMNGLLKIALLNYDWKIPDVNVTGGVNGEHYTVTFPVIVALPHKAFRISLLFRRIENIIYRTGEKSHEICHYAMVDYAVREMVCAENETYSSDKVVVSKEGDRVVVENRTKKYYRNDEFIRFNVNAEERIAFCDNYKPTNCSRYINLTRGDNWQLFPNQSLYGSDSVDWYHYGEYSIIDDTIWLCAKDTLSLELEPPKASVHNVIMSYLTVVSLSVSIISLCCIVGVYSRFPQLRNIPGKNLLLFSTTLALSHLLWLLQSLASNLSSTLCVAYCLVSQYVLLSAICTSGSIAFDCFITFYAIANGKLRQGDSSKKFILYTLYSLGTPFVFVSALYLFNYYKVIAIKYMQADHCWFGDHFSFYVGFVGPLFTQLFANAILFIITMYMIKRCTIESQKLSKKNGSPSKSQVLVYIRMSTLMGFTWILGALQMIFPGFVLFHYIFILINGFQGFYIAVAFLLTKNVRNIVMKKGCKESINSKRSSSNVTRASHVQN